MRKPPPAFISFIDKCETQQDAASKLGVSTGFVSQILSGRSAIPARRVIHWAEVIGCKVADLRPDMVQRRA